MKLRITSSYVLVALFISIFLSGCGFRPSINEAFSTMENSETIVKVAVSSNDAERIKSRQMYFSVVVFDCQDATKRWPLEAFIGGSSVEAFDYEVTGHETIIIGTYEGDLVRKISAPCVMLEGGGYLSGRLQSEMVPLRFE